MTSRFRNTRSFRAFIRGDLTRTLEERRLSFTKWRATIPYTDKQIADAFTQQADDIRSIKPFLAIMYDKSAQKALAGNLSGQMLWSVMPVLVKTCSVCGGKALYRRGSVGLCRKHKGIIPSSEAERNDSLDRKMMDIQAKRSDADKRAIEHKSANNTAKFRRHSR